MTHHLGKGEEGAKGGRAIDREALAHAHVTVIAGACMAIGLKVNHLPAYMPLHLMSTSHLQHFHGTL